MCAAEPFRSPASNALRDPPIRKWGITNTKIKCPIACYIVQQRRRPRLPWPARSKSLAGQPPSSQRLKSLERRTKTLLLHFFGSGSSRPVGGRSVGGQASRQHSTGEDHSLPHTRRRRRRGRCRPWPPNFLAEWMMNILPHLSLYSTTRPPSVRPSREQVCRSSAAHRVTVIHAVEAACRDERREGGKGERSERFRALFCLFILDAFSPKN